MKDFVFSFMLFGIAVAVANGSSPVCSWTSSDHRTIQARFLGVGPSAVLIEKDGSTFVVPFSRLAPESIAQAKNLGGLSGASNVTKAADAPKLPADDAAKSHSPAVATKTASGKVPASSYARMSSFAGSQTSFRPAAMLPVSGMKLDGRVASTSEPVPDVIERAIDAGNRLQTKPYKWGGGRAPLEDTGYDCSGSVSYVLIKAGLLQSALTSGAFTRYGEPGPGKWITIYARPGHVFMTICGLRLDTGGRGGIGESGPRWSLYARGSAGCSVRHPPGF